MKKIKQSLLPLGVMVLGAVAAFATTGKSASPNFAAEDGYITTDLLHPCNKIVQCTTIDTGDFCSADVTEGGMRAYGKWNITDVVCTKTLYKLQ